MWLIKQMATTIMKNLIKNFQSTRAIATSLITAGITAGITVGTILVLPLSATAATLKITVDNPSQGVVLSPLWLGFHDGSFNTFDPGAKASSGIEAIAEDGIVGLEPTFREFDALVNEVTTGGVNLPAVIPFTISSLFAQAVPTGTQTLAFENELGIFPNGRATTTIDLDPSVHSFLSYAAMVVPSNDGFIADETALKIFDDNGDVIPTEILLFGSNVFDAGTEVNDENLQNIPLSRPTFAQTVLRGTSEDGTIQPHPLIKEAGLGGFLDVPLFSNSDFTRNPDALIARFTIEAGSSSQAVPEPTGIVGLLMLGLWGARRMRDRP